MPYRKPNSPPHKLEIPCEIVYTHGTRIPGYLYIRDLETQTSLFFATIDQHKGKIGNIIMIYAKDDIPQLQSDGINTENLSHFEIFEPGKSKARKYDKEHKNQ